MSKATVTRLFIGSLIGVAAGTILAIAAVWLAIANEVFVMSVADIVGIHGSALAWSLLGLGLVGGLAIAGGMIGGLVAWIGALLNTWKVDSRAWFVALLLLGIFNLGFIAMIAYLISGPDGTTNVVSNRVPAAAGA
jgi:hypothetical protein